VPTCHYIPTTVFACPHQIPGRLLGDGGNPDLHDLAQMQQAGQMRGIAGVFSELENDLDFRGLQGCFLVRVKGFGGWVESGRWWCG
jgi:hypothetical protein